ncbi:polymorphic toxin type 44 domain-containing protein [Saccharomonospora glauca]|uniref:Bacterial toxin 44 domain-containing protein n=1 Tax=Saccharomonospora glauca K62 TaxID=928724 RepID=I1D6R3_9PSEU|nr:polymorphic toxin type 44 domain-containing protein [Saccharomonospora glauca]EIF00638.1 hypothetical protein SacglDRAFT_03791 [Saccharomonospora glauca K62]
MLSYESVYNAPVDKLDAAVEAWTEQITKLKTLSEDMDESVVRATRNSGWSGPAAETAISFIDETAKEFTDAIAEATGIRDILREACDAIRRARDRLREIAEVEAPKLGLKVSPTGEVEADSWIPGSDWWNEEEIERISKEIERARVAATEADDSAAAALARNVNEEHDFNAPTYTSLADAEAKISEGRFSDAEKFMFEEMMRNVRGEDIKNMRENTENWYSTPEALLDFFNKVKADSDWDHKPILEDKFGLETANEYMFKIPGDPKGRSLSYDAWSNIHYGYVGMAAGIDEDLLMQAGSLNFGPFGRDDPGDQITMRAGIELYKKYGENLTQEQFHQEIMKMVDEMEAKGVDQVKPWKPTRGATS